MNSFGDIWSKTTVFFRQRFLDGCWYCIFQRSIRQPLRNFTFYVGKAILEEDSRLYISFPRSSNTDTLVRKCQLRPSLHFEPRNMRVEASDNHQSHSSSPSRSNECLYKASRPSASEIFRPDRHWLPYSGATSAAYNLIQAASFFFLLWLPCNVIALLCTIYFSSSEFRLYKVRRQSQQQ